MRVKRSNGKDTKAREREKRVHDREESREEKKKGSRNVEGKGNEKRGKG